MNGNLFLPYNIPVNVLHVFTHLKPLVTFIQYKNIFMNFCVDLEMI